VIIGIFGCDHQRIFGVILSTADRAVRIGDNADLVNILMRQAVFPTRKCIKDNNYGASAGADDLDARRNARIQSTGPSAEAPDDTGAVCAVSDVVGVRYIFDAK
jgi:hypothetical protein